MAAKLTIGDCDCEDTLVSSRPTITPTNEEKERFGLMVAQAHDQYGHEPIVKPVPVAVVPLTRVSVKSLCAEASWILTGFGVGVSMFSCTVMASKGNWYWIVPNAVVVFFITVTANWLIHDIIMRARG